MNEISGPNVGVQFPVTPDEPAEMCALSAQHLRAYTRRGDDDAPPDFVIHDEEVEFAISHEVGTPELAILGFKRLASAALAHAQLLEQQAARSRGYS